MNAVIRRRLPKGLALLTAAALGLSAAPAQDRDLLRDAVRERELATQKAEADVQVALRKASKTSASEGLSILKGLLADVEGNKTISEDRRVAMTRTIRNEIRIKETAARSTGERITDPPAAALRRTNDDARRADYDRQEAERQKIKAAVNEINRLVGQGRTQEADRQAADLARQFPDNPAARVMGQSVGITARIRDARQSIQQQEQGNLSSGKDLVKSSTLPREDMEYDKETWRKNAKSKFRGNGEPLTEKEQAILKAMSKTMRPDWKGAKFDEVREYLQAALGVPIVVDQKALEEANVGTDATVTFSMPREVTTRTVLRKVLQDLGLGYVIRNEMIQVTSLSRTRDMMTTRTYYLADLVTANALTTPPALRAQQEEAIVKPIIDTIKRSVDPMSWEGEGGKASINYDPVTKSLIVRQSAEVHMLLRNSLAR